MPVSSSFCTACQGEKPPHTGSGAGTRAPPPVQKGRAPPQRSGTPPGLSGQKWPVSIKKRAPQAGPAPGTAKNRPLRCSWPAARCGSPPPAAPRQARPVQHRAFFCALHLIPPNSRDQSAHVVARELAAAVGQLWPGRSPLAGDVKYPGGPPAGQRAAFGAGPQKIRVLLQAQAVLQQQQQRVGRAHLPEMPGLGGNAGERFLALLVPLNKPVPGSKPPKRAARPVVGGRRAG